jgi:hypothetical protein
MNQRCDFRFINVVCFRTDSRAKFCCSGHPCGFIAYCCDIMPDFQKGLFLDLFNLPEPLSNCVLDLSEDGKH